MSTIAFTKATACGNSFLLIDGEQATSPKTDADLAALTRRLCDPNFGVGADGVEWLFPDDEADTSARLFNSDGTEAEISGNGTRCVAADLCERLADLRETETEIAIRTGAGIKVCRFVGCANNTYEFEIDMGQPRIIGPLSIYTSLVKAEGMRVSMGNPHYVIPVSEFREGWQKEAALIGAQPQFPQGTNVEYVKERDRHEIEVRFFERGAGETQSSGTGSCAAAIAAIAGERAKSPVTVHAPGGSQTVRWQDHVYLQGLATIICKGEFFI